MLLAPLLTVLFLMASTLLPMAALLMTQESSLRLQNTQLQLQAALGAEFQSNRATFRGVSRPPPFPTPVKITSAFSKEAINPSGALYKLHIVASVSDVKKERTFWMVFG